jgi:hypothetical protein
MSTPEADAAELTAIFARVEAPCAVAVTRAQGKHLTATAAVVAGAVLFEEKPVVAWPFHASDGSIDARTFCAHCLRPTDAASAALVPCAACGDAFYCTADCAERSAGGPHGVMCGAEAGLRAFHMQLPRDAGDEALPPISVEALARCAATLAVRYRRVAAQNAGVPPAELFPHATRAFDRFVEPPHGSFDEIDAPAWCAVVRAALAAAVLAAVGAQEVADALLSDATLLTLLGQMTVNAQALNLALPAAEGRPATTVSRGAGMFTLHSCFNHSCDPNVAVSFGVDSEIGVVALRDIAAGEELCITYIAQVYLALEPAAKRRERLRPYFFVCQCAKCAAEDAAAAAAGADK